MDDRVPEPVGREPLFGRALSASLTVRDIHSSLSWYRDAVGFTVEREFEREGQLFAVSMRAGDVEVLITRDDGAKGAGRSKGEGISLMISTSQNVDAIAERVRQAGYALDSEPTDTPWGMRAFRVRDPDGFKFTIASGR